MAVTEIFLRIAGNRAQRLSSPLSEAIPPWPTFINLPSYLLKTTRIAADWRGRPPLVAKIRALENPQ
jgi:hypothetical protein